MHSSYLLASATEWVSRHSFEDFIKNCDHSIERVKLNKKPGHIETYTLSIRVKSKTILFYMDAVS
jgi:hypothetical protein